jgi:hypothetical protein
MNRRLVRDIRKAFSSLDKIGPRFKVCSWCGNYYYSGRREGLTCSDSCAVQLSRSKSVAKDPGKAAEMNRERQGRFRARHHETRG